jgi:transaldolase/glucose-6-phosphate isomerase
VDRTGLGPLTAAVDRGLAVASDVVHGLVRGDASVVTSAPDAAAWIGWVEAPADAERLAPSLAKLVADLDADGVTDAVLVGMGGSSLYAEVLERVLGPATGAPRLWVLDSTDPAALLRLESELPWASTVIVAASKSGTTIEVRSLLERLLQRLVDAHGTAALQRLVVLTDPGTPLEELARERGARAVVHGRADVGGRYSALSVFGLLPAALLGHDPIAHVAPARRRAERIAAEPDGPALREVATLAAFLAAAVELGRDKVALALPPAMAPFGSWLEQLVAESLGKGGRGPLPVLGEDLARVTGADRAVVAIGDVGGLDTALAADVPVLGIGEVAPAALSAAVLDWELAVSAAGVLLGVDPFDQPDVSAAKSATARVLATGEDVAAVGDPAALVAGLGPGDHLALLAYVDPGGRIAAELAELVVRLRERLDVVVTLGIGPRYLHSTGQAHKGGAPSGAFLIVVGDDPTDAAVPGAGFGLSRLKRAQAAGDAAALAGLGRRVVVCGPEDVLALA